MDLSLASIADVAEALVENEGLDSVTGSRIAAELGASQPAIYRHLDTVDDVWRELGLRGRASLRRRLADAAIGRSGQDAVVAMAHAWRDWALAHPGLYQATDRYPCAGDPELEAAVEAVVSTIAMTLRGFQFDEVSVIDAARTMRSFLHGYVHLELGDGHPHKHDNDASFARAVQLLAGALPRLAQLPHSPDEALTGDRR